ncbi:putative serine/threonine-protein kinase SIS8 [Frankliniella fusca]|uniref:Serine/threonine-protein kinase SIS8 n=1 Tax=Frankliniella fusca TaxID=407009 RepID=A0AAE1HMR6_9NEOP|nr:putative serine/threonine-protein kinase SIS8 [Frankliniella fusca]
MEGLMLWVVSIAVAVCLMCALWACLWGCRKTEPKNELLGLAGMVKLTNPDEAYSQNGQWPSTNSGSNPVASDSQSSKRCSTSANRSLPDLPVDVIHLRHPDGNVIWENQETGGDTGSELYATVEENSRSGAQVRVKKIVPRELSSESKEESESTREGTSPSCQPNVGDEDEFPTYARLRKEHPYDKLKKCEHPYAQVRPPSSREPDSEQTVIERTDGSDPVPPPRARKSLSHGSLTPPQAALSSGVIGANDESPRSLHSGRVQCSPHGSTSDIGAAVAISGRISASQDLPYMTPPITSTQTQTVQHFSGDSQDSSKGYTSISVREPLANIRRQRPHDSHYATVSDDSDEMYAAIEDPSQVYTSGSETYAQIQPLALATLPVIPVQSQSPEIVECEIVTSTATQTVQSGPLIGPSQQGFMAPQPPSVDSLKHVAQAHSRQASSSSATSSVANLGSPKPEKRPANSPLPPPPANPASPEGGCSLEDMYAKVVKKKRGSSEETDSNSRSHETDSPRSQPSSPQRRFSTPLPSDVPSNDPGYETVSATEIMAQENSQQIHPGYETVRKGVSSDLDPNYEELQVEGMEPGYAHIRSHGQTKEPKYARLSQDQSSKKQDSVSEPDYASISRGLKVSSESKASKREETDDPGYEQVRLQKQILSEDSDHENPGYERVHARNSGSSKPVILDNDPGYEQVRLARVRHNQPTRDEDYEGVALSHADPNYETVHNEEPNYESVQYCNNSPRGDSTGNKFLDRDEALNPLLGSNRS